MQKHERRWGHAWNSPRLPETGGPYLVQALSELGGQPRQSRVDEMLRNSLVLSLPGPANLGVLPTQVPRVLDLCFYGREVVAGRAIFFERNAALQHGSSGNIRPAERRLSGYGGTRGRQKGIRWENYAAQDNVNYWDAEVGLRALHDEPARMIFGDDFVDSKLYAVLGGGSLSAQIHYAIQSALFGGSWQPSSAQRLTGQITDAAGFYGGSVAQDFHKDGGWFRSDKNETRVSPASAELDTALDQLYGVVRNTYTMLGDVFADPALIAKVKQLTYGVYLPDMSNVIEKLGADLTESMGRFLLPQLSVINRVAGEAWLTTFERVSKEVDAVTGMFGLLGTTIREAFSTTSTDQLFALSDALVAAMGGLEAMAATTTAYYQRYYSDQERFDAALKQLRETLIGLGVSSIPRTTAEFRALIEAQDLTTAAGQKTYVSLMSMSTAFADLADALVAQVAPLEAERLRLAQAVLAENDRLAAQAPS